MVAIKDIVIPPHRKPDPALVPQLAASIAEVELLNPIILTPERELVTGRNRIAAFVELGRTHIPARTATWGMLERELAEIDENIVRRRFSVLERGRLLTRKKELYEVLHPEARQHVRGGHAKAVAEAATETLSVAPAFASDAASKLGTSERTVREEIRIATELSPRAARILRGTPLEDEKVLLMELTRLDREQQVSVARLLVEGRTKTVRSAVAMLRNGAGETEKKNKPRRRKSRDIAARMREIAEPLQQATERWDPLIQDLHPALVQGAKEIGAELKALTEKIAALTVSAVALTEPPNHHQAQAMDLRDGDLPVVATPAGELAGASGVLQLALWARELKERIVDAASRFQSEAHDGDPTTCRAVAEEISACVRALNARIPIVEQARTRPTNGPVGAPASRKSSPSGPPLALAEPGPAPQPLAVATSVAAPPTATQQTPTPEEVAAVVVQIIDQYKAGLLRVPFQGQAEILKQHWPPWLRDQAIKSFIAMLNALPASARGTPRSGSSAGAPLAARAGGEPSRPDAWMAQSQEIAPTHLEAPASRGPSTPGIGEFARAVALARAPLVPSAGSVRLPSDTLTQAARLAWANTE